MSRRNERAGCDANEDTSRAACNAPATRSIDTAKRSPPRFRVCASGFVRGALRRAKGFYRDGTRSTPSIRRIVGLLLRGLG
jgi:hypothetical protein